MSCTKGQIGIGTLIIFIAMVLVAAVAAAVLIQTSGVLQQDAMATGREASKEVSSNIQIKQIEGFRSKNTASNMSPTIDVLRLTVGLNAASEPVDLNQVIITISDGYVTNDLVYAANDNTLMIDGRPGNMTTSSDFDINKFVLFEAKTGLGPDASTFVINQQTYYIAENVRDDDNSFTHNNPVISSGDIINIYVPTTSEESDNQFDYLLNTGLTNKDFSTSSLLDLSPRATVTLILTPEAGASATADFILPTTFGENERVALYP